MQRHVLAYVVDPDSNLQSNLLDHICSGYRPEVGKLNTDSKYRVDCWSLVRVDSLAFLLAILRKQLPSRTD